MTTNRDYVAGVAIGPENDLIIGKFVGVDLKLDTMSNAHIDDGTVYLDLSVEEARRIARRLFEAADAADGHYNRLYHNSLVADLEREVDYAVPDAHKLAILAGEMVQVLKERL